jgi:hypothetical protein
MKPVEIKLQTLADSKTQYIEKVKKRLLLEKTSDTLSKKEMQLVEKGIKHGIGPGDCGCQIADNRKDSKETTAAKKPAQSIKPTFTKEELQKQKQQQAIMEDACNKAADKLIKMLTSKRKSLAELYRRTASYSCDIASGDELPKDPKSYVWGLTGDIDIHGVLDY